MSAVLKPAHAEDLRSLRQANPTLGIIPLAALLAERCGLDEVPSQTAMHRFMVAHGIDRAERAWPSRQAVMQLAQQAFDLSTDEATQSLRSWRDYCSFTHQFSEAFSQLLLVEWHQRGAADVDPAAVQAARGWLDLERAQ
jgi:hypothetical protein